MNRKQIIFLSQSGWNPVIVAMFLLKHRKAAESLDHSFKSKTGRFNLDPLKDYGVGQI